jgi:hypothetical protein
LRALKYKEMPIAPSDEANGNVCPVFSPPKKIHEKTNSGFYVGSKKLQKTKRLKCQPSIYVMNK